MKVAVLGNGGFGTAMAIAAVRAGREVAMWGHDPVYTAEVARTRRNPRYLPDVEIPVAVAISADPVAVLVGAEVVLVAVPTQHLRGVVSGMSAHLRVGAALVSLAKGLEQTSGLRPSEVLTAIAPGHPVLALSGPSHAEEVARGLPALVVLAGATPEIRRVLQQALSDQHLRVYRNDDLLGVELCGALKNVIALAAGIAEGIGLGDNARAAILSRGLAEMVRFGVAAGARAETFYGLAGVGDLAVTAFSQHGRNRALGVRIGRGETLQAILASTQKVAEGVYTSRVVRSRAAAMGVEMPLCDAVCRVLFEQFSPVTAVRELMERDRKREMD
ncbi:MAG: NAD(P)H-dependent glycerol-3-phosphate dehydrogenase [Planctomycetota bacterium]